MAQSAWGSVYGTWSGNGVPDVHRASFRRAMTRIGVMYGAATAASVHVAMFLVNAVPRGIVGGVTAFFWQVVTLVPLTIVHVLAGLVLGWLVNKICVAFSVALRGVDRGVNAALCGALGAAAFAVPAAVLAAPSLLLEADPRFVVAIQVLIPLVAAIGGGVLGVVTALRVRAYLEMRGAM